MQRITGLVRRRWVEARDVMRSTSFDALADLGSEANRRIQLLLVGSLCSVGSDVSLALARRLVELHGGSLTAASASGRGAVFTATLPEHLPLPGAALDDDAPLAAEPT